MSASSDFRSETSARAKRGPTLRAQWLGQQLRELREAAGLRLTDAAEYLQRSQGTLSRFESADYPIRRPEVLALLDLYHVSDERQRAALISLSEEVWRTGWWDGYAEDVVSWLIDYVWVESRAETIRTFDVIPVHGLLQTQAYAETLIRTVDPDASEAQVQRWVELRMARQELLERELPPSLSVILDEAVLKRTVGGHEVMTEQLRHLAECASRPNIEIRVLPSNAGAHASPAGAFSLLTMAAPFPEVACVESPAGAIYLESPATDPFATLYDRLWQASLGSERSTELISTTSEELQ